MRGTIRFLANDRVVETDRYGLGPALDFIRRDLGLTGTKEGCREGDCGACSVLVGERWVEGGNVGGGGNVGDGGNVGGGGNVGDGPAQGGYTPEQGGYSPVPVGYSPVPGGYTNFAYRAQPSCIMALAELDGRHLVTIEGLSSAGSPGSAGNFVKLTPVMRAILDENGSQCGFCSPGFVVSLTAFLLNGPPYTEERAFAAIEGNLCRCTGYGALKRAAQRLARDFADLPEDPVERLTVLVERGVVPRSLLDYASGAALPPIAAAAAAPEATAADSRRDEVARTALSLGGGSDFLVRHPDPTPEEFGEDFALLSRDESLRGIRLVGGAAAGGGSAATDDGNAAAGSAAASGGRVAVRLEIGAAVTWREFFESELAAETIPSLRSFERLLASPLVRERATLGGNVGNASPVADATSMLIALGASVRLRGGARGREAERELPLEKLFLGYKKLDLRGGASPGAGTARDAISPEIIAAFLIPAARPIELFNFEKASKRERLDIAAVNTAAAFEAEDASGGKRITRARISAGGVAPVPLLLERASASLAGRIVGPEAAREAAEAAMAEASPIGDVRGGADYRRRVLGRLVIAHFVRLFPLSGCEEALR